MKKIYFIIIMVFISLSGKAQTEHSWGKYLDELYQFDDDNISSREDAFEVLTELEQHPININTETSAKFIVQNLLISSYFCTFIV